MKGLFIFSKRSIFLLMVLMLSFQSCKKDNNNPPDLLPSERGDMIKSTTIGTYSVAEIQQLLDASGAQLPFTLDHPVEVLSVNYYTIDGAGGQIIVSGAMLVPQGVNDLPLLSMQHGTETKRDLVASVSPGNSVEGIIGLVTASMGYMTVVPDYPGFGVSNVMHPYMQANSLVPCVVDFMRACKSWCLNNQITLDGRVFLSGYSEGGYVTLLTQKTIEEQYATEFDLTAVAPSAGPYDLAGMTDTIFNDDAYGTPAYVAYFITAYNKTYGWNRLDDFFNAPYATMMTTLFDGSKTWGHIINQLPETFSELMNPAFVEGYLSGGEAEFKSAVSQNTFLDWIPQTPLHFFHGDADQIVPIQNALTAVDKLTAKGVTNIQITTIPGGTHATAGPASVVGTLQWFEGFQ
jgi:predicted esterase